MKQAATTPRAALATFIIYIYYLSLFSSTGIIILQASGLTSRTRTRNKNINKNSIKMSTTSMSTSTTSITSSPAAAAAGDQVSKDKLFKIRTITAFVTLHESDFNLNLNTTDNNDNDNDNDNVNHATTMLEYKIKETVRALQTVRVQLEDKNTNNLEVQTLRIATNPFPEYLLPSSNKQGDGTGTDTDTDTDTDTTEEIVEKRLKVLDECLERNGIIFFSLGSASTKEHLITCTQIVQYSMKFSCSVQLQANDVGLANASAETILRNSKLIVRGTDNTTGIIDGLANFRFCVANVKPYIPFFPAAKSESSSRSSSSSSSSGIGDEDDDDKKPFQIKFAIGLENGELLKDLLMNDANQSIANILPPPIPTTATTATIDSSSDGEEATKKIKRSNNFATGFSMAVRPIQTTCEKVVSDWKSNNNNNGNNNGNNGNDGDTDLKYIGLDASFNPSLDKDGSVASAIELLNEVSNEFGGPGTIAAVAAMTTAIQTKLTSDENENENENGDDTTSSQIKLTGYNGLMLPLCEDIRLAQLAINDKLTISQLLNVSSVCGVGIDTVPIAGDTCPKELASLLLDVVGLAQRWNKPLSCRVFPVPNKVAGDMTAFDSPYLVNSKILKLS